MIGTEESCWGFPPLRDKPSFIRCAVRHCGMRTGISISVTASDRARLEAIVAARSSPQKHGRARIILLTDQGLGTNAIMAATSNSKTCVWRLQERFMAEGVEGLLRDKTQPPGIAPLDAELVDKVVALTLEPPGHEARHLDRYDTPSPDRNEILGVVSGKTVAWLSCGLGGRANYSLNYACDFSYPRRSLYFDMPEYLQAP